jgi:hypothetical protein
MADDPSYLDKNRRTLRARLGHWTAEVVLVFVGVSAAFWLNNYQQHEQEAKFIFNSSLRWQRKGKTKRG